MVRFACRDCPRVGRYRLAVLAERCGADTDLEDVLAAISANCPRHRESHLGRRCRASARRGARAPAGEGRRLPWG